MKKLPTVVEDLPQSVMNVEKCLRVYNYETNTWEIQTLKKSIMKMMDTNLYYPTSENNDGEYFTNIIVKIIIYLFMQ